VGGGGGGGASIEKKRARCRPLVGGEGKPFRGRDEKPKKMSRGLGSMGGNNQGTLESRREQMGWVESGDEGGSSVAGGGVCGGGMVWREEWKKEIGSEHSSRGNHTDLGKV